MPPKSEDRSAIFANEIAQCGDLAFDPDGSGQSRSVGETRFRDLVSQCKTLNLMPVLSALIQPGRVKPWLRPHLVHALALLPLRPQGVRDTIEFIFAVHPSTSQKTGTGEAQTVESRGSGISLEALNAASRVISSPPSDYSPDAWFSAIAPQLFSLLDGEGGLEMIKVASFIIGYGILGRKASGAPGAPGWKTFAEPLLSLIDPNLKSDPLKMKKELEHQHPTILDLRPRNIIVEDSELSGALRRLSSLVSSHPNPGLSKRLLDRLVLPLWSLSSWAEDANEFEKDFRAPARFLLQIVLQLSSDSSHLLMIARNLLYQGNQDSNRIRWAYKPTPRSSIQIEKLPRHDSTPLYSEGLNLGFLDDKLDAFIEMVKPSRDIDHIPSLFLSLCQRWFTTKSRPSKTRIMLTGNHDDEIDDLEGTIVEAKLMQNLIDSLPDRLVSETNQIVQLASNILYESTHNLIEDDTVGVALSLLNLVIMSKNFTTTSQSPLVNTALHNSLVIIATRSEAEISITARNLLLLLQFKSAENASSGNHSITLEKGVDDRKTYSLALSYLTGADSPPPVRAQGLDLLSGLIATNSPLLDIPATLILLASTLSDDEEYIYLRVIKTFILVSKKHAKTVMLGLMERYIDAGEEAALDSRLRFGEALLQVIQNSGHTFTGELAVEVGGGLLKVAGRRGYRAKHQMEQAKKAAILKSRNQEAEEAWDGPVPQLEENTGTVEREVLVQIVDGWDSKTGEEDVRIRASALSIIGSTIETNIAGIGSSMASSAVDLSINILALESEHEKAILRRAAILLIMSLVRALDDAQEKGTKLGFGFAGQSLEDVVRILRYISETDNDGLVRHHAKDVMEGLGTWQMKGLLASKVDPLTELDKLAGLSISREMSSAASRRPRIEEIG